jgi:hypothetical protein
LNFPLPANASGMFTSGAVFIQEAREELTGQAQELRSPLALGWRDR